MNIRILRVTAFLALLLIIIVVYGQKAESSFEQSLRLQQDNEIQSLLLAQQTGLEKLMLHGDAEKIGQWEQRLQQAKLVERIDIFRADGQAAFADHQTVDQVNQWLKKERFHEQKPPVEAIQSLSAKTVKNVLKGNTIIQYNDNEVALYTPIPTQKACLSCHGYDEHPYRGISRILMPVWTVESQMSFIRKKSLFPALTFILLNTFSAA